MSLRSVRGRRTFILRSRSRNTAGFVAELDMRLTLLSQRVAVKGDQGTWILYVRTASHRERLVQREPVKRLVADFTGLVRALHQALFGDEKMDSSLKQTTFGRNVPQGTHALRGHFQSGLLFQLACGGFFVCFVWLDESPGYFPDGLRDRVAVDAQETELPSRRGRTPTPVTRFPPSCLGSITR